jgi:hypothetical protein
MQPILLDALTDRKSSIDIIVILSITVCPIHHVRAAREDKGRIAVVDEPFTVLFL